ncbi:hypothetical protein CTI12_AA477910 [Artemisia annua]|uniref:Uncharacterized protein n=1 Tax=Artemisia annua TaxID=35608 RepID=A0A2U1LL19_ARTAN|nr:hypothetical protein CTI12_AA477910 [Artemisia annua]
MYVDTVPFKTVQATLASPRDKLMEICKEQKKQQHQASVASKVNDCSPASCSWYISNFEDLTSQYVRDLAMANEFPVCSFPCTLLLLNRIRVIIATPRWFSNARDAAICRASINVAPMVSHTELLYDLAVSISSRLISTPFWIY